MKQVAIIGGGVAGMEAACSLAEQNIKVTIIEKTGQLGGHVRRWHQLFPNRRNGKEVFENLQERLNKSSVDVFCNIEIVDVEKINSQFRISLSNEKNIVVDSLLLATGFELFAAEKKEEYGYNIYDNVTTQFEMEERFCKGQPIINSSGKSPQRIGIVHCVGSRDVKVGNEHCSKVCCVTGVKQAIELKERMPNCEIFCFYMDLRMFGLGFEELYKEAQEKWKINFVRGRLSEASENQDGTIVVKVEDTLTGRPLRMNVDLLVLLSGIVPSQGTTKVAQLFDLPLQCNGFIQPTDEHLLANRTIIDGLFVCGTVTSPKTISETIGDARSASLEIIKYLNNK